MLSEVELLALQVLKVRQKFSNGMLWDLKLELGTGNQPGKVYEVEVSQSLQNQFKLENVKG